MRVVDGQRSDRDLGQVEWWGAVLSAAAAGGGAAEGRGLGRRAGQGLFHVEGDVVVQGDRVGGEVSGWSGEDSPEGEVVGAAGREDGVEDEDELGEDCARRRTVSA